MTGKRGRPSGSKDTVKRARRPMTEREKQRRRNKNTQMTGIPVSVAPNGNNNTNNTNEDVHVEAAADVGTTARVTVTFSDNSPDTPSTSTRRPIIANLDLDDEDGYDSDGDDSFNETWNEEDDQPTKEIQQLYLKKVHAQLKVECNAQRGKQNGDWLIEYLKHHDWWIRKENAPSIAKRLSLTVHHVSYYRDVRIWIPDMQYGSDCMPACPCCKTKKRVTVHGFNSKHYGRTIIDLTQTYFIITRRYRCNDCKEKNEALKRSVDRAFNSGSTTVEIDQNFKYTFMAWNEHSLPLYPRSLSEEFPAFLTHKAGLDKKVIDLMRPLIDKGVRPEEISDLLLEMHSKEHSRCNIRYEEDSSYKNDFRFGYKEYSEFDDVLAYRGMVPSGRYLKSAYVKFHSTIRRHLANEVKKRGAERLSIDVSYKSAKHMCQYKGEPIFKGLLTATNEYGEIRIQFHVISDSHEQMNAAFESFLKTTNEYGYPDLKLITTDNPAKDRAYLLN
jgi:hypothetical protein